MLSYYSGSQASHRGCYAYGPCLDDFRGVFRVDTSNRDQRQRKFLSKVREQTLAPPYSAGTPTV